MVDANTLDSDGLSKKFDSIMSDTVSVASYDLNADEDIDFLSGSADAAYVDTAGLSNLTSNDFNVSSLTTANDTVSELDSSLETINSQVAENLLIEETDALITTLEETSDIEDNKLIQENIYRADVQQEVVVSTLNTSLNDGLNAEDSVLDAANAGDRAGEKWKKPPPELSFGQKTKNALGGFWQGAKNVAGGVGNLFGFITDAVSDGYDSVTGGTGSAGFDIRTPGPPPRVKPILLPKIMGLPPLASGAPAGLGFSNNIEGDLTIDSMPVLKLYPMMFVLNKENVMDVNKLQSVWDKGRGETILPYPEYIKRISNTIPNSPEDGVKCIQFAYLNEGPIQETFTNDYGESIFENILGNNSGGTMSELARTFGIKDAAGAEAALKQLTENGDGASKKQFIGGDFIKMGLSTFKNASATAAKMGVSVDQQKLMFQAILGAGLEFPNVWKGSSYNANYSFTIRLYNPQPNDTYATRRYIIGPLACLMSFVVPISTTGLTYNAPYVCKFRVQGLIHEYSGYVKSVSVIKGGDNNQIAYNQIPGIVDVKIDMGVLYQTLISNITDDSKDNKRPSLSQYLEEFNKPKKWHKTSLIDGSPSWNTPFVNPAAKYISDVTNVISDITNLFTKHTAKSRAPKKRTASIETIAGTEPIEDLKPVKIPDPNCELDDITSTERSICLDKQTCQNLFNSWDNQTKVWQEQKSDLYNVCKTRFPGMKPIISKVIDEVDDCMTIESTVDNYKNGKQLITSADYNERLNNVLDPLKQTLDDKYKIDEVTTAYDIASKTAQDMYDSTPFEDRDDTWYETVKPLDEAARLAMIKKDNANIEWQRDYNKQQSDTIKTINATYYTNTQIDSLKRQTYDKNTNDIFSRRVHESHTTFMKHYNDPANAHMSKDERMAYANDMKKKDMQEYVDKCEDV